MNNKEKELIQDYILLPLALKVLDHDMKLFEGFSMRRVYLGKLDSCVEQIKKDIVTVKKLMYSQYHIDVKQSGNTSYQWRSQKDSGTITYTSDELRDLTKQKLEFYFYKSVSFEPRNEIWKQ